MTAPSKPFSQFHALLIIVAIVPALGPLLYTQFTEAMFTASPAWWARWLVPTVIGALVLGVLALPVCRKFGMRWVTTLGTAVGVAVIVSTLMLFSLPMLLAVMQSEPVRYTVTVSSTTSSGKKKCDYPFSIDEIWQSFCAQNARDHAELNKGQKIEVIGKGNASGMFIEGYQLLE